MTLRSIPTLLLATLAGLFAAGTTTAQEGTLRWRFLMGGEVNSSPALSTGTGSDFVIYVGTEATIASFSRLFAVNANGSTRFQFSGLTDWVTSSPTVADNGAIIFGSYDSRVFSLNASGAQNWSYTTNGYVASSAALGSDGTIYIGSGDSNLHALRPDGSVKWSYPVADWVDSAPAVGPEDTIYFGSYDNNVYAVRSDGTLRWQFTTGDNVTSSPAIGADATVYIGSYDRKLYALDGATGSLKWSYTTGGGIASSPVVGADGTVYFGSLDGYFYALHANGTLRWRYNAGIEIYSSAAIRSDGVILFGANYYLYALNGDGSLRWRYLTGDYVDSSPTIAGDGTILVGSSDRYLYAIRGNGQGLDTAAPWPMHRQNVRRTARSPLTSFPGGATPPPPNPNPDPTPTPNPTSPPTITSHPDWVTVTVGSPASFTVGYSGQGPFNFEWYKDGSVIPGANTATLSFASAQTSDAAGYSVRVGNAAGNTFSFTAYLTVNLPPPPTIATQPASQTVTEGGAATFFVSASGTGPFSYQWHRNGNAITGATSSSHTLNPVQLSDAAGYSVRVSNAGGSLFSTTATLTVEPLVIAPEITTPPASATVTVGSPASFSVSASGTAPFSYSWYRDGEPISGATAATYTIASTQLTDAGAYTVRVSNSAGQPLSNAATLTVNRLAQTLSFDGPSNQGFTPGPLTLTASASSGLPVSFTLVSGPAQLQGSTLTLTGVGDVTLRAEQAGDSTYAAAPAVTRTFTVHRSFALWQAENFTAQEITGGLADPSTSAAGDGLPNLLKYALGLAARPASTGALLEVAASTEAWTGTFTAPNDQPDVTLRLESSTDLVQWTEVPLTEVATSGNVTTWRGALSRTGRPNLFLRLKALRP